MKGILSQVGLVVLSPVLSLSLSRLQPFRFTGRIFLLLALYPFFLFVSALPGVSARIDCVYLALFLFSVAMAGVNLSWSLGSMHFAGNQDAATFQGIHVTMTGIRGLFAPSLGFLLYKFFGSVAVFAFSTIFFVTAGILMLRQDTGLTRPVPAEGKETA
jgi:hypothetical protein